MKMRTCQIAGCQANYYAKGFCLKHYHKNRMQQKENPTAVANMETAAAVERACKVPGCDKKYYAKGFCASHYQKNRLMTLEQTFQQDGSQPSKQDELSSSKEKRLVGRFTGMTRELDSLGRIVLPIELRRVLGIEISDALEIFVDQKMIILRKYAPGCIFCGNIMSDTVYFKGKIICEDCLSSVK